jgi:hypothetical protein
MRDHPYGWRKKVEALALPSWVIEALLVVMWSATLVAAFSLLL